MPLPRLRWLILALLFSSTAINYIDRQALSVMLPVLRRELGLTTSDYGTITGLFMVAYMLAQAGTGRFIDKVGTKVGFTVLVVCWSGAAMLHALARGPASLGLFRFLLGISEAGNWPAGCRAVAQWFPKEKRAFAMGIFDGGSAVGAIIAPPLVAFLALHLGWRSTFLLTGTIGFFWVGLWWLVYDGPATHRWLSTADRAGFAPEQQSNQPSSPKAGIPLRELLGQRTLWGLLTARMFSTPVWWFYVFWLPDYLDQKRGFSLVQIGLFAWIPFLTVDLGKIVGGALSDFLISRGRDATWARKGVMLAGAVIMIAGVQVVGAPSAAAAIAWVCVATFGFGLWSANILALHADIFPSASMASVVGITGTGASLGGALFTFCVGLVVSRVGYTPVFWAAGFSTIIAGAALIFVVGRAVPVAAR